MTKTIFAMLTFMASLQLTATATAQGSSSEPQNIQAIVDSICYSKERGFVSDSNIIGAAIGVYYKGQTHYFCYGFADKAQRIKTGIHTRFEIGSNTKVFTGLMLSAEIADQKMSGDDFIDQYVPVNKGISNKVRLNQIANHISGLPTFHDSASLAELINQDTTKDPLMLVTDDYVLSVLKKTDSLHNPGTYAYSNFGVGLLGYILQQKEKKSYDQLLQKLICRPMQLTHTTAVTDTTSKNLARGYYKGERMPFLQLCPAMQGAGAITSDIADMTTFIKTQLEGNKDLQLALNIAQEKQYKEQDLQMAMGWHIGNKYGTELYEMRGDTYGASSTMLFNKEHDLGIVVLLNTESPGTVGRIRNTILASLLDTSDAQNRFKLPEIMVDGNILQQYIGVYELEPGVDATVSVDNGKLALQITGQSKAAFKAVSPNWFVFEKYNCQLEFHATNGSCTAFKLYQNGAEISCKRKG